MYELRDKEFKDFCIKEWQLPNGEPAFGSSGDFNFREVQDAFNAGWDARKKAVDYNLGHADHEVKSQ